MEPIDSKDADFRGFYWGDLAEGSDSLKAFSYTAAFDFDTLITLSFWSEALTGHTMPFTQTEQTEPI